MGVMVAVLSLSMAFVMSLDKPKKVEARQNNVNQQDTAIKSTGCGCTKNLGEKRGCGNGSGNGGQRSQFVDANKDGQCDKCGK